MAQALGAPVIAVVDVQRATSQCNACKTALAQLEGQLTGLRTLQSSLETPLRTEAASIQTAATALAGKAPDAALQARATAFQKRQNDAQRQLAAREQTFQRNRAYVLQQISDKLNPVLASVMTRRGANVMFDAATVIQSAPGVDVTNDVIAALNATLTSVATTAPAQAAPTRR
ncbi:MAG: OmpH family outer membrane protein [Pseudomonadota bacterium]|nr:OmpH family outer membrane protein [Pseudomonadota bacterium]